MKKKKKIGVIVISVLLIAAIVAGGVTLAVRSRQNKVAKVYALSNIGTYDYSQNSSVYGTVQSGRTQEIYLDSSTKVQKVLVEVGQKVKVGDPVLQYDTTMLEISMERRKLGIDTEELQLSLLLKEIEKLQRQAPSYVSRIVSQLGTGEGGESSGSSGEDSGTPGEDPGSGTGDDSGSGTSDDSGSGSGGNTEGEDSGTTGDDSGSGTGDDSGSGSGGNTGGNTEGNTGGGDPSGPAKTDLFWGPYLAADNSKVTLYVHESLKTLPTDLYLSLIGQKADIIVVPEGAVEVKEDGKAAMKEGQHPLYTIEADFTQAAPLPEGVEFSVEMEFRKVRNALTIVTVYQSAWPSPYRVIYPLFEGAETENLVLQGVTDAAYAAHVTLTEDYMSAQIPFAEKGGLFLLSAGEPLYLPGDPEPGEGEEQETPLIPVVEPGMTLAQIKELLSQKESEYIERQIALKLSRVELQKTEKQLNALTILSEVNGYVKEIGDPAALFGTPYIVLSEEAGFYVVGIIDELSVEKVKAGQKVLINSWMSGQSYEGSILEISEYPVEEGYYYSGNRNSSSYTFTARVESMEGEMLMLQNGEGVDISILSSEDAAQEAENRIFYIPNMFIRTEQGESYVYRRGEDGKLERVVIQKGKSLWGSFTGVLSGVTESDYLAFPYDVSEGMETEVSEEMGIY